MSSSTSLPEALPFSAAEPRALFDAQTSTPYSWTPTNGLIAGEPFGVQHNGSRVLVSYAFLDLEADSGFPGYLVNVVDESAPANNWQPMPDKTLRMDNDTIKSRDTDGAYEVAAQSFPITERFDKFVSGANLKFKDFWQGVLGAINGLITVQNSVQRVFDITHPIGEVYIQFPQQSAPADLYNRNGIVSGWHNISSSYAGRFFRAEGGSAAAFGTAQGGGAPNITGSVQGIDAAVGGGRSLYAGDLNDWMPVFSNISRRGRYLNFDASRSSNLYGAANEIRPENYAIRIWIRVS